MKKFVLFVLLLVFLLLLLHTSQACASELEVDALIVGAGQGSDIGSTFWALHRCPSCTEGGLLGSPGRVAAGKAVFSGATVLLCRELRKSGHGREARWLAIGVAVAGGAFAAHNLAVARRRR